MGRIDTYPQNAILQPNSPVTLAYAQSVVSQATVGAEVDITGCVVSVTIPEGRRIKVSARSETGSASAADTSYFLLIKEGSTIIGRGAGMHSVTGREDTAFAETILTPSAGIHTYKITGQAVGGTVTFGTNSTDNPSYILVEDITGMPLPAATVSVPVGTLAQTFNDSTQTTSGTADLSLMTVNVTVPAGRVLRITHAERDITGATAADSFRLGLYRDGSFVRDYIIRPQSANFGGAFWEAYDSPTSGVHTYEVRATRLGGSGVLTFNGFSGGRYLLVEDVTGTPAAGNGAPASTLAYAEVTTSQGSITTTVDLTGLTVTVTVPAGRRLKVTGKTLFKSTVANDRVDMYLYQDGSIVQLSSVQLPIANAENSVDIEGIFSPAAGTHTYKLGAARSTGTGTITMSTLSTFPSFILVEDVTGAAYTYTQPGVLPVSSTALPAGPQIGAMVYEIDTGATKIYNGTSWQIFGQGSSQTLGYAQVTTSQGSITAEVDLTNLSVTVTVPAGRRIQIIGQVTFTNTGANQNLGSIKEGSTYLAQSALISGAAGTAESMSWSAITSPSAGTHTYKLAFQAIAGTASTSTNTNNPVFILVEDITGTNAPAPAVNVPVGQIGYAEIRASQGSITSEVDITGLSVNVSVPSGRVLKITSFLFIGDTVTGDEIRTHIKEGSTFLSTTAATSGPTSGFTSMVDSVTVSPSAGSHTYKVTVNRQSGTGTLTATALSDLPSFILVEDITPTPAVATGAPSSTLAYAEVTTAQTGITAETDLSGLSVTVTVIAGRRLKITGSMYIGRTVADGVTAMRIKEGATQLHQADTFIRAAGEVEVLERSCVVSPSAGSHTYKLTLALATGTGTTSMSAAATFPAYILVEDVTGVSVPGTATFSPPSCRVYHNTTQSMADNVETAVVFNSERWDTNGMHDTVSLTNRITIQTSGLYLLTFNGLLPALTTYSYVYSSFRINGVLSVGYAGFTPTAFSATPLLSNTTVYKLSAGDYVEVLVYQDNTANTAQNLTSGGSYSPEFSATWMGTGN